CRGGPLCLPYYSKPGIDRLIRIDYHGAKEVPTGTCQAILRAAGLRRRGRSVIDLKFSLVIEATADPAFFGFYSPDLDGFTGTGKSGIIAQKIASTMVSTGTPAMFLHPAEGAHGDIGIAHKDDVILAISKSGESDELIGLLPTIRRIGARLITITTNADSAIARQSDVV